MATRLPPAHAPAIGRRRQEGIGGNPGRGPDGLGPPGLRKKGEVERGERGRGGSGVGRAREVETIVDRAKGLGGDREVEDRNRQRRLTEEEARIRKDADFEQRRQVRRQFDRGNQETRASRNENFQDTQRSIDRQTGGDGALRRAVGGLERAADLLSQGRGAEAALVLSAESREARAQAMTRGRQDASAKVLGAVAANMDVRAESLKTIAPGQAKKLAQRAEQIAEATMKRADQLDRSGRPGEARLLASLANDSRAQALLVASGASNTDALLGRALARVLHQVADASFHLLRGNGAGTLPRAEAVLHRPEQLPRDDGKIYTPREIAGDRQKMREAFRRLDRLMGDDRRSFHGALDHLKADPRHLDRLLKLVSRGDFSRPEAALQFLRDHALTGDLVRRFDGLSRALSSGDPRAVHQARNDVLEGLRASKQLHSAQEILRAQNPLSTPNSVSDLVRSGLPSILLRGILSGGLSSLASSSGLGWLGPHLKAVSGPAAHAPDLLPSERLLTLLAKGKAERLSAEQLGSLDSLLLGTLGLFGASGTVSRYLRSNPINGQTPLAQFDVPRRPSETLRMLSPAGSHELAVFADGKGRVLVRGSEGPTWHQGFAVDADGQRFYFNAEEQPGLSKTVYQSAAERSLRLTRLELPLVGGVDGAEALEKLLAAEGVDEASGERVLLPQHLRERMEAIDDEHLSRLPNRKRSRRELPPEKIAAVAIFQAGFQGLTSRTAVKLAQIELTRLNRQLPEELRVEHYFVESCGECSLRLMHFGPEAAKGFEAHLREMIEAQGFDPQQVSGLILLSEVPEVLPELTLVQPQQGTLVAAGAPVPEPTVLSQDFRRDPALMKNSVLLYEANSVVVD